MTKTFREYSDALRQAQANLKLNPNFVNRKKWEMVKNAFDLWAEKYEICRKFYSDLHFHKYGNKAGSMLARQIRGPHKQHHIPKLPTVQGDDASSPEDIAQTFQDFYQRLYEHDHTDQQEGWGRDFLAQTRLEQLTQDQLEDINAPLTVEEIDGIIKSLPKNKAPGPDGTFTNY